MSKRETAELIKDGHSIFIKELEGSGLPAGSGGELDRVDGLEL